MHKHSLPMYRLDIVLSNGTITHLSTPMSRNRSDILTSMFNIRDLMNTGFAFISRPAKSKRDTDKFFYVSMSVAFSVAVVKFNRVDCLRLTHLLDLKMNRKYNVQVTQGTIGVDPMVMIHRNSHSRGKCAIVHKHWK